MEPDYKEKINKINLEIPKHRNLESIKVGTKREKQLLTKGKRLKVVRFLISPNKKKVKIEVNKIMNPAFLLGTAFNIAYWHRKYHSGTICKGETDIGFKSLRK